MSCICIYDKNREYGSDYCLLCSAMCPERRKEFEHVKDENGLGIYVRKGIRPLEELVPEKLYNLGQACISFVSAYETYHQKTGLPDFPKYVTEPNWDSVGASTIMMKDIWEGECKTCKDFFDRINPEEKCLLFKWFDKHFYNFMDYLCYNEK